MEEYPPHHPKIKGLSPSTGAGIVRENGKGMMFELYQFTLFDMMLQLTIWPTAVAEWLNTRLRIPNSRVQVWPLLLVP